MELKQKIQHAATIITQAKNIVALTGAGISTPSGIPDFRSPTSGLWDKVDPMTAASIYAFRQNPKHFYDWIHPLAGLMFDAEPNPAHIALATLEKQGRLKAVITQNIDNLHQKAGSQTVYELHGHMRDVTCQTCQQVLPSTEIMKQFIKDGQVPKHNCGGVLKPNVILFGEQLPMQEFVEKTLRQYTPQWDKVICNQSKDMSRHEIAKSIAKAALELDGVDAAFIDPKVILGDSEQGEKTQQDFIDILAVEIQKPATTGWTSLYKVSLLGIELKKLLLNSPTQKLVYTVPEKIEDAKLYRVVTHKKYANHLEAFFGVVANEPSTYLMEMFQLMAEHCEPRLKKIYLGE